MKLNLSTCNRCGATIAWCWSINRKNYPVDPEPQLQGTLILIEDPVGNEPPIAVNKSDPSVAGYVSHFDSCPER